MKSILLVLSLFVTSAAFAQSGAVIHKCEITGPSEAATFKVIYEPISMKKNYWVEESIAGEKVGTYRAQRLGSGGPVQTYQFTDKNDDTYELIIAVDGDNQLRKYVGNHSTFVSSVSCTREY